jgi:hypothetical protein
MATTTKTKAGSAYLLCGVFGYCIDKNPFRAYAKMAQAGMITGSCEVNLRETSALHEVGDRALTMWYLPSADLFHDLEGVQPVDILRNPCGTIIYGDTTSTTLSNHIKRKIT